MKPLMEKHWHHLPRDEVLDLLDTNAKQGLDRFEVEERQQNFGPNVLTQRKGKGPLLRFMLQFHQALVYILLAAVVIKLMLGAWVDASVIFGVVLLNSIIGFVQEGKALGALAALASALTTAATVVRAGEKHRIDARELVPGDIVLLASGDKVPADLRLLHARNLQIDESALTGESVPVEKSSGELAHDAVLAERSNMAYSSTLVTYGTGVGVVTETGDSTEIGRISELIASAEVLATPLTRKIARFSHVLLYAILVLAGMTFTVGLWHGGSAVDMFMAAVAMAVAMIPEGLPAVLTITLAIGVARMAKRHAIIRHLPAVETLGSTTVICSDKTGTLTRNEMTVQRLWAGDEAVEVTGVGYTPQGELSHNGQALVLSDHTALSELLRAGLLCNDATLTRSDDRWCIHGDPTEAALITLALKAGLNQAFQQEQWPRTDVIPFESQHRFMSTLHHDHAGHGFVYLKGAPERVLDMCMYQRMHGEDLPLDRVYWANFMDLLASRGQRLLAIAFKVAAPGQESLKFADVESGLTLLGIVGIIDPPREAAIAAVRTSQAAGIRVKMITGDHAITASAIGRQMGIGDGATVVQGVQLDERDAAQLREQALAADVFARTSPEHKLRLVEALQANGQVVAMTGDGVNDAPALKRADVGDLVVITVTQAMGIIVERPSE